MIVRVVAHLAGAVVGIAVGAVLVLASTPTPAAIDTPTAGSAGPDSSPELVKPAPAPTPAGDMLLAWTPGRLPDGFADGAGDLAGVTHTVVVDAGSLDLTASRDATGTPVTTTGDGWAIPVDTIAIDPDAFAAFAPTGQRPLFDRLVPGTVLLGTTSARLRDLDIGGQLTLAGGRTLTVAGIVDDATIGAAELVVHHHDELAATLEPRYVLLHHDTERATLETALRGLVDDRPVRVRALGETPYLRHGDAVLPQAIVKDRYGEFAYRPPADGGLAFDLDADWVDSHIVTATVPLLGTVTCHRATIEPLRAVLAELDRRGLGHTVDPEGYAGCFNPRLIAPDGGLSRHSWGIAVDLNADGNPTGTGSGQHPSLVETATRHGWGWGGTWLIPDPMHFELVDTTADPTIKTVP